MLLKNPAQFFSVHFLVNNWIFAFYLYLHIGMGVAISDTAATFDLDFRTVGKGQFLNESQKGLSGVETHARLSITHYKGKTEVSAVTSEPIPGIPGTENGVLIFKILRNAMAAPDRGKVCIVGRNPDAIWFDDYEDRVIFDEAGLFEYRRVEKADVEIKQAV